VKASSRNLRTSQTANEERQSRVVGMADNVDGFVRNVELFDLKSREILSDDSAR
jgi:hypothetical protein